MGKDNGSGRARWWPRETGRSNIVALGLAGAVEYTLQAIVPVILVRYLTVEAVAQYRFLWLMTGTALAVAPAFMPQALFYFLPRAGGQPGALIGNTLLYLALVALLAAALTAPWQPFLPAMARQLFRLSHGMSSLFIGLWLLACLLDVLPTAEGRARWQAAAMVVLALLRTALIVAAALAFGDLATLVGALLLVALLKLALLLRYLLSRQQRLAWHGQLLRRQLAYALPFACGNALFLLRGQADQWVVAGMLPAAAFAPFAIAGVFLPLAALVRVPVNNVLLGRLNSAHAAGQLGDMARLIAKANGMTAMLLLPLCGGLMVMAPELVQIIYTARYRAAVPVMQVLLIGVIGSAFAVGHVLAALDRGRMALLIGLAGLVLSVGLSIVGVQVWGLAGAAIGSVATLVLGEAAALLVVAAALGTRVRQLLAWSMLVPTVLATSLAGLAVWSAGTTQGAPWPALLMKCALYGLVFLPVFVLSGGPRQLALGLGLGLGRAPPAHPY